MRDRGRLAAHPLATAPPRAISATAARCWTPKASSIPATWSSCAATATISSAARGHHQCRRPESASRGGRGGHQPASRPCRWRSSRRSTSPITGAIVVADVVRAAIGRSGRHCAEGRNSATLCRRALPAHKVPARSCVSCRRSTSPSPARWLAAMRNVIVTGGSRGLGLRHRADAGGGRAIRSSPSRGTRGDALPAAGGRSRQAAAICISAPSISPTSPASPALVKGICAASSARSTAWSTTPASAPSGMLATMPRRDDRAMVRLNVLSPHHADKYVVRSMMAGERRADRQYRVDRRARPATAACRSTARPRRADRLHPVARARTGPARHHRQRRGARLHRYRNDATSLTPEAARADRAAQRAAPPAGDRPTLPNAVEFLFSDKAKQHHRHDVLTVDAGNTV